jgi:hypothetical protein
MSVLRKFLIVFMILPLLSDLLDLSINKMRLIPFKINKKKKKKKKERKREEYDL